MKNTARSDLSAIEAWNGSMSFLSRPLASMRRVLCTNGYGEPRATEQGVATNGHKSNGKGLENGAMGAVRPLSRLSIGAKGVVVRLSGSRRSRLKLASLGVVPGAGLVLEQRRPALLFRMGRSRFAVDEELGASIEVCLAEP